MLTDSGFETVTAVRAEQVRAMDTEELAAAFISLPLEDESGEKLAGELAAGGRTQVCAIVKADVPERAVTRLTEANAFVMRRPVSRPELVLAAGLLAVFSDRSDEMLDKIAGLEHKNSELKLMSRAKLLLMETRGMSENDAHRYILRQAMNGQISIEQVCRELIAESGEDGGGKS